jgi:hypothetical protein
MDRILSCRPIRAMASRPAIALVADRRAAGRDRWHHRTTRLTGLLLLLALGGACVTAPRPMPRGPRVDRTVITEQQIREGYYSNAYEVVEALRSNWLRPRGPDGSVQSTPVWVYVNANRAGGVEALRTVLPRSVVYIRFYDGLTASARWGAGHGQGVIFVSTLPPGATKIMPFD